jgi:hypothetical protein
MKIKFEVEVKELKKSNGFADRLIAECQDDKRQLDISYKVNKATTIAHSKLMDIMIKELNEELIPLGCSWKKVKNNMIRGNNEYYTSEAKLLGRFALKIDGKSQRYSSNDKMVDTRYTTFCGEYRIMIESCSDGDWRVIEFDDILDRCKEVIMANYMKGL